MKYNLGKKNIMNMERKSGIYMWTSPSGKSYIGQSVNLQKRKCAFLCFGDRYGGQRINRARNKYNNKRYWKYKVLEYCDIDKLDERERYYINLYDTINNGYNCESGGNENKIVSDESKQKLSEAKKGKYCEENNPMYGKHLTEEHKSKLSEAMKGKNSPNAKRIYCVELDMYFNTVTEASEILGCNKGKISSVLKGNRKTCGGYYWEYVNAKEG